VDTQGISKQLNEGAVVLLSPLGYSATGEAFNLTYESVATEVAIALNAEKLVLFSENQGLVDSNGVQTKLLSLMEAESLTEQQTQMKEKHLLVAAATACKRGVPRTHLIGFDQDGALLKELFTRSGEGTLILQNGRETIRQAALDDIPGLLEIIAPLEEAGVLVKRSRELLEAEISRFYLLVDAENIVVACAALYPFPNHSAGELACVATHGDYKNKGFAGRLLEHIEKQARLQGLTQLFVLTTQTAHWFLEQGFEPSSLDSLPEEKQALYNYTRKSKIFVKVI
jgi:amino-acid N-acetyltransferase